MVLCYYTNIQIPYFIKLGTNHLFISSIQFSSVAQLCPTLCDPMDWSTQSLPVRHQLPELPKLMSIESVMPSNHLIICYPLFLLPSIFPSIRVFSNGSALHIRWPKYWSFSFSISPSNKHPVQKHQFFGTQLSSQSNFHIHT